MITRDIALASGTFGPVENGEIYDKWFNDGPSHFLKYAIQKYDLQSRSVIDVGSAYGHALRWFGPGSFGVELNPETAAWANAVGLKTLCVDMEIGDVPQASAIWCRDVLEHADSPHLILRRLWWALEDEGLAFLALPLTNPARHLGKLSRAFNGWAAADHINFFTDATLRETLRYAGFDVVELTMGFGPFVDAFGLPFAPACVAVARKKPGWEYPAKSTREVDGKGYQRKTGALHRLGFS